MFNYLKTVEDQKTKSVCVVFLSSEDVVPYIILTFWAFILLNVWCCVFFTLTLSKRNHQVKE